MRAPDWVSAGEFETSSAASVVATSLTIAEIPNKLVRGVFRDPRCSIWVPPEYLARAREIVNNNAVPESELDAEALSYPPPDDA